MDGLFLVRLSFVLICGVALVLIIQRHERIVAELKRFFFEPQPPINLGLVRAVVFSYLLMCSWDNQAGWFATLPDGLRALPRGWDWLGEFYPTNPAFWRNTDRLLILSSFLATIGLFTRPASILAVVTGVLAFGHTNFYFKMGHSTHVPMLTAIVLAASPAGHAFSIDALLRRFYRRPPHVPSVAYTIPVRFAWLLLGTMYLFPGIWKLWESGDLWISGTKMRVELLDKWAQMPEFYPLFRVDQHPILLAVFGTATLVFEIGFFAAVFHRKTRVVAGIVAAGFHVGTGLLMNIWFNPLHPLIVFFDYPQIARLWPVASMAATVRRWLDRWRPRQPLQLLPQPALTRRAGSGAAAFVLGCLSVAGMFVAGIAPIDTWPVAIYPRFSGRQYEGATTGATLRLVVRAPNGSENVLTPEFMGSQNSAVAFRLAGAVRKKRRGQPSPAEAKTILARIVHESSRQLPAGSKLLIYSERFPVDPDARRAAKPSSSLVGEVEL